MVKKDPEVLVDCTQQSGCGSRSAPRIRHKSRMLGRRGVGESSLCCPQMQVFHRGVGYKAHRWGADLSLNSRSPIY